MKYSISFLILVCCSLNIQSQLWEAIVNRAKAIKECASGIVSDTVEYVKQAPGKLIEGNYNSEKESQIYEQKIKDRVTHMYNEVTFGPVRDAVTGWAANKVIAPIIKGAGKLADKIKPKNFEASSEEVIEKGLDTLDNWVSKPIEIYDTIRPEPVTIENTKVLEGPSGNIVINRNAHQSHEVIQEYQKIRYTPSSTNIPESIKEQAQQEMVLQGNDWSDRLKTLNAMPNPFLKQKEEDTAAEELAEEMEEDVDAVAELGQKQSQKLQDIHNRSSEKFAQTQQKYQEQISAINKQQMDIMNSNSSSSSNSSSANLPNNSKLSPSSSERTLWYFSYGTEGQIQDHGLTCIYLTEQRAKIRYKIYKELYDKTSFTPIQSKTFRSPEEITQWGKSIPGGSWFPGAGEPMGNALWRGRELDHREYGEEEN